MPAYRDGGQGVVHTEFSRDIDLHIEVHQSGHMVLNSQVSRSGDMFYIHRPKIGLLGEPEGLHPAGGSPEHIGKPLVVHVADADPALLEQQPLAPFVIFKVLVLIRSDMVFPQIGENADLKGDPRRPVKHKPLGGNFHDHTVAASLHHLGKIILDGVGFRRGVAGRDRTVSDQGLDGADQPHLVSHFLQNRLHHISGGGLPLGPGNADHLQLLRRISVVSGRHQRQCIPGVFHLDQGQPFRRLHFPLHDHCNSAFFRRLPHIGVPVGNRAFDTDKHAAFPYIPGIVVDLPDFYPGIPLNHLIFQTFQQFCKFHAKTSRFSVLPLVSMIFMLFL